MPARSTEESSKHRAPTVLMSKKSKNALQLVIATGDMDKVNLKDLAKGIATHKNEIKDYIRSQRSGKTPVAAQSPAWLDHVVSAKPKESAMQSINELPTAPMRSHEPRPNVAGNGYAAYSPGEFSASIYPWERTVV